MPLAIKDLDGRIKKAVKLFWETRKRKKGGKKDVGERGNVTGGKHLDGFVELFNKVILENGLPVSSIQFSSQLPTLPGYFRPTKKWDLLAVHDGVLVAAIELKSQCGPSFGNNFNNRSEEALGNGFDLQKSFREGAFGKTRSKPFIGFVMFLEDCDKSCSPVKTYSPHFPVLKEFENTTYAQRYELLCDRLVKEGLYTAATVLLSKRTTSGRVDYSDPKKGMKTLVTELASHVAAVAAQVEK